MATSATMRPKTIRFIPLIFGILFLFIGLHACDILHWVHSDVNFLLGAIWLLLAAICSVAARVTRIAWEGSCPYCGYDNVTMIGNFQTTNCRACKQKIVRRGATFFMLDELK